MDARDAPAADALGMWQRHSRIGWWSLFAFSGLGLALDALHGLKVDWYLNVATDTRRLMWTLAHTHGTLLSLVNLAFAATVLRVRGWNAGHRRAASGCLIGATILLPMGFFLGGAKVYAGDPGLGSVLVPPGGVLLLVALLLTALAVQRQGPPTDAVTHADGGKGKRQRRADGS